MLDALSPLRHVALDVSLGEQSDLGAEEAKALAQALAHGPGCAGGHLHTLSVNLASGLRALDFIAVHSKQPARAGTARAANAEAPARGAAGEGPVGSAGVRAGCG